MCNVFTSRYTLCVTSVAGRMSVVKIRFNSLSLKVEDSLMKSVLRVKDAIVLCVLGVENAPVQSDGEGFVLFLSLRSPLENPGTLAWKPRNYPILFWFV